MWQVTRNAEVGRREHWRRADAHDIEGVPEAKTSERAELQDACYRKAEVEVIGAEETKEHGEHESGLLGLSGSAAFGIGPVGVTLTKRKRRWQGSVEIPVPIVAPAMPTAHQHRRKVRIGT